MPQFSFNEGHFSESPPLCHQGTFQVRIVLKLPGLPELPGTYTLSLSAHPSSRAREASTLAHTGNFLSTLSPAQADQSKEEEDEEVDEAGDIPWPVIQASPAQCCL